MSISVKYELTSVWSEVLSPLVSVDELAWTAISLILLRILLISLKPDSAVWVNVFAEPAVWIASVKLPIFEFSLDIVPVTLGLSDALFILFPDDSFSEDSWVFLDLILNFFER